MSVELQAVSPHVWLYPYNPDDIQPNVGVIITAEQTVLVDAGNSPRHARRVLTELWRMGAPPVTHVIYTHYHWDHTFGAQIFNCPVVAHDMTLDLLQMYYANKPWSAAYLQEEARQNPDRANVMAAIGRAVDEWRGFHVVLPELLFSHDLTLHLADLTLHLRHVGGRHAADSITVEVVEDAVLFIGDSYYPPPPFLRQPGDGLDVGLYAGFIERGLDWYIEGHNRPLNRDEAALMLDRMARELPG